MPNEQKCSLSSLPTNAIPQEIRANYTSPLARFAVSNLHPGSLYIVSIYAFNSKGRSDPAVLQAAMLRLPEKQLTSEKGNKNIIYNFMMLRIHFLCVVYGLSLYLFVFHC